MSAVMEMQVIGLRFGKYVGEHTREPGGLRSESLGIGAPVPKRKKRPPSRVASSAIQDASSSTPALPIQRDLESPFEALGDPRSAVVQRHARRQTPRIYWIGRVAFTAADILYAGAFELFMNSPLLEGKRTQQLQDYVARCVSRPARASGPEGPAFGIEPVTDGRAMH
jgi:hypothetical protein